MVQCLSDESDSLERVQTCHLLHAKPTPTQLTIEFKSDSRDKVELQIGGQAGAEAGEAEQQTALRPKGDYVEVRVSATTVVNHPTPR